MHDFLLVVDVSGTRPKQIDNPPERGFQFPIGLIEREHVETLYEFRSGHNIKVLDGNERKYPLKQAREKERNQDQRGTHKSCLVKMSG